MRRSSDKRRFQDVVKSSRCASVELERLADLPRILTFPAATYRRPNRRPTRWPSRCAYVQATRCSPSSARTRRSEEPPTSPSPSFRSNPSTRPTPLPLKHSAHTRPRSPSAIENQMAVASRADELEAEVRARRGSAHRAPGEIVEETLSRRVMASGDGSNGRRLSYHAGATAGRDGRLSYWA